MKKLKDGTYNKKGQKVDLVKGYQVSVKTEGMSKNKETRILKTIKPKEIFTGVWKGQIERSFTITNKAQALKIAKKHKQEAIWDNKNGKAIYVKNNKKLSKL